jgi:hypothetical protein
MHKFEGLIIRECCSEFHLLPAPAAAVVTVGCGLSSSHARKLLCSAASSPPQFASALPVCSAAAADAAAAPAVSLGGAAVAAADAGSGCAVAGAAVLSASSSVPAGALSENEQLERHIIHKFSTVPRQCRPVELPLHKFSK